MQGFSRRNGGSPPELKNKDVLPMDALLKKFLPRIEFDSYEDFKAVSYTHLTLPTKA